MRHHNRGTGGNLGIIGIFLCTNYFWWIVLLFILVSIPSWVYITFGVVASTATLAHIYTNNNKEEKKDENKNKNT
jgi:hypothetical protein